MIDIVTLLARLALGLVFLSAGAAKLFDRSRFLVALTEFGLESRYLSIVAWGVPLAELLTAFALVFAWSAWYGALLAFLLLVLFEVAVAQNLVQGRAPDCGCFGQLHSAPISWRLFNRNLALLALAVLILWNGRNKPGVSAFFWVRYFSAGEVVLLAFSVLLLGILAVVLRRLGDLTTRQEQLQATVRSALEGEGRLAPIERQDAKPPKEGLPLGAPAPGFTLLSSNGRRLSLSDLLTRGKPVVLIFVSHNCRPCRALASMLPTWQEEQGDSFTIAVISRGGPQGNTKIFPESGGTRFLIDEASNVHEHYRARWTPAAVRIDPSGRIASSVRYGIGSVAELFGEHSLIADQSQSHASLKLGAPAPQISLLDLAGERFDNESFLGQRVLLLFWDPKCPYCQQMTQELCRWEQNSPDGAPVLVLICSADAESCRDPGCKSLTLLDSDYAVTTLFGVVSHPSGILLDEEGRIASSLARGPSKVLALAGVYGPPES